MNQAEYRVHKREGTLDTRRCQHCEAVAARPLEHQIHDPERIHDLVLYQMQRPDRIALQEGIVWGFVNSSFEILKQTVLKSY